MRCEGATPYGSANVAGWSSMRRSLVAVIVISGLAGLGAVSVPFLEDQSALRIKETVDRSGSHTVGSVDVSLLARRVTFHDMRNRNAPDFAIGRMQVSGLAWPLGDLLSGRLPYADYRPGDPLRADRIQIDDARFSTAIEQTTIKSMTIDAVDLGGYDGAVHELSKDPDVMQNAALQARLLAGLSMGKVQMTQFTHSVKNLHDVRSDRISMDRVDHGRVGSFTASNMTFVTPGNEGVDVAEFKVTDLDFRRLLKNTSSPSLGLFGPVGHADVGSMYLAGFGGKFLSRYGLALDGIGFTSTEEGPGESRNQFRVDGLVFTLPREANDMGPMAKLMQQAGLKELKIGLDCRFSSSRPKAILSFERCALAGPAIGEVDFTASLVEVDKAFWKAFDEYEPAFMNGSGISVDSARLRVMDRGIVDFSLKAMSISRSDAAREIRRFQPPSVLISQDMTALLDTVAGFVEKGGVLTIDANPDSPIALNASRRLFTRGADLMSMLGLSASRSGKVPSE